MFCRVENNKVVEETKTLPMTYGMISAFCYAAPELLQKNGWYRLEVIEAAPTIGEKFDKYEYVIEEFKVIKRPLYIRKSAPELKAALDELKAIEANKEISTKQQLIQSLINAVQMHLDDTVREKNYDNIFTACTYATSTDEIFKAEGQKCVEWRDAVWRTCYNIMYECEMGRRFPPTPESIIDELPVIVW